MTDTVLLRSAVLGASAGARSMTPLAQLALRRRGWVRVAAGAAALGEMAFDKSRKAPSRLRPAPLAGRVVLGAIAGATFARRRGAGMAGPAVVAGLAAAAASFAGARWRTYAVEHDFALPGAIAEDGAAIALAWASSRD
ncbi:hypothetical protein [Actinoplanes regularis]|uniref:DUF4126 domain-containing protein n=1 Tax=Actinoplanes regularis TaxID=52697 RepID=A0A239GV61_9ACTN|nr:hypothetical protein [Actinoplanes regularis]GIE90906.1 hypothetical protein Are01nite_73860 [Actinoplanes regularis]SNS73089.1 hypothetical protein SAMN06264365_12286 [Actinoplanes regularis]